MNEMEMVRAEIERRKVLGVINGGLMSLDELRNAPIVVIDGTKQLNPSEAETIEIDPASGESYTIFTCHCFKNFNNFSSFLLHHELVHEVARMCPVCEKKHKRNDECEL